MSRSREPGGAVERRLEEGPPSLAPEALPHLRELLLTLADSKRLLGLRYSDCMLGAPSLETGIAAASMAQDEWGHSRLTYALLGDLGEDPGRIEHEREAGDYHSISLLDRPLGSYESMIAASLLIDGALRAQYEALRGSAYGTLRTRVEKLLEEEALHRRFASAWTHRLASTPLRERFLERLDSMLPETLRWFGPPDDVGSRILRRHGLSTEGPEEMRARLLAEISPVLDGAGLAGELALPRPGEVGDGRGAFDWGDWDPARRRTGGGGPDADALARVRGDRNREMLLD